MIEPHYLYILYSVSSDKFYVGISHDPWLRLHFHNTQDQTTFTSKHRPWRLEAVYRIDEGHQEAVRLERFIKKQKSRKLIVKLISGESIPTGNLAQLVRVPHVRD